MREGRHSAAVSIGYTDEFVFHLKKHGKGKINKFRVIGEQDIDAWDFEEAFSKVDSNIVAGKRKD